MSYGYSSEPQFPTSFDQPRQSGGFNWLIGLLCVGVGILLLGGVVCVAGIWYVGANVDRWLVGLGREAIVAMINESEIPAEEKREVITQVDRVVDAYKARKIDQTDLERVLSELEQSPALTLLGMYELDELYLEGTELDDAEIAQGRRTFERVLRGVYEGKIREEKFYNALPQPRGLALGRDNGGRPGEPGEEITLATLAMADEIAVDDLRESLVKLKVMADNAGIPDEPFQLDIGDEVKKLVDKALAGEGA